LGENAWVQTPEGPIQKYLTAGKYSDLTDSWSGLTAPENDDFIARFDIGSTSNRDYVWICAGYSMNNWDKNYTGFDFWAGVGFDDTQRYSKVAGEWSIRTPIPPGYRIRHFGFYVNSKSYFCGGYDATGVAGGGDTGVTGRISEYNDTPDSWSTKNEQSDRGSHGSFIANGRGHLCGGTSAAAHQWGVDGDFTGWMESTIQYNPLTDSWSSKTDIPEKRIEHTCFSIEDKGYLLGGLTETAKYGGEGETRSVTGEGEFFAYYNHTLHEYNEVADTYTRKANIQTGQSDRCRDEPSSGALAYGYFVSGLRTTDPDRPLRQWIKATDTWVDKVHMDQVKLNQGVMVD
jgi:hypothetical protein